MRKKKTEDNQQLIENSSQSIEPPKKTRGRPKKIRTAKELAKLEKAKKKKLSLAEKQAIKLKRQQERQAAKRVSTGSAEPKNKERFYCTNKDIQLEMEKWRDSNKAEEDANYEIWLKTHITEESKRNDPYIIDYTKRTISEELGLIFMKISQKVLNHTNFRNYSPELKADMQGFFFYKVIKGLKNYNFKFNNPFAWLTQCAFNSYLNVICKHYKDLNIKKDLMGKLLCELQTYDGIDPRSSLNRCIKTYISDDEKFLNSSED